MPSVGPPDQEATSEEDHQGADEGPGDDESHSETLGSEWSDGAQGQESDQRGHRSHDGRSLEQLACQSTRHVLCVGGVSMRFVMRAGDRPAVPWDSGPIRAELLSAERLEIHAEGLATLGTMLGPRTERSLARRMRDNGRVLLHSYSAMTQVIREEHAITPAAEWLVDNFHVVDEVLRSLPNDLPRGFYRELPKLADGPVSYTHLTLPTN